MWRQVLEEKKATARRLWTADIQVSKSSAEKASAFRKYRDAIHRAEKEIFTKKELKKGGCKA